MSGRLSAGWGRRKNLSGGVPGTLQSLLVVAPNACYKDILFAFATPMLRRSNILML
jgi:hypothetical protein